MDNIASTTQKLRLTTRISDSLLLFYVVIASNFLIKLFPKHHFDIVKKNIYVRHFMGYITMLFSIYHVSTMTNPLNVILLTTFLYLWFLMTTRLPPVYNLVIIFSLSAGFLINLRIYHEEQNDSTIWTKADISRLKMVVNSIFIFIILLTVFGYIYQRLYQKK